MANKRNGRSAFWKGKEEKGSKETLLWKLLPLASLALIVVLLLLLFTDWAAVYNTDIAGNEVKISGFNCVSAALSGEYSSPDKGRFGNMAVPFNYYASSYVRALSQLTAALLFILIAHALLLIFTILVKRKKETFASSALFALAEVVLFFLCYSKAISMEGSDILPIYCGGNPACSIRSDIIIAGIVALFSLVLPAFAVAVIIKQRLLSAKKQEAGEKKVNEQANASNASGQKAHPRATAFKGNRYSKK